MNPVSEPASGRTHFHVHMEMSDMQLDKNLEFRGEVQTIDESLAKGGICSGYLFQQETLPQNLVAENNFFFFSSQFCGSEI